MAALNTSEPASRLPSLGKCASPPWPSSSRRPISEKAYCVKTGHCYCDKTSTFFLLDASVGSVIIDLTRKSQQQRRREVLVDGEWP